MRFFISLSLIVLLFQSTTGFAINPDIWFKSFVDKTLTTCVSFFSEVRTTVSNSKAELTLFKFGVVHVSGNPYYGGFIPYNYLSEMRQIKKVEKLDGYQGFKLYRKDGSTFILGPASEYYQEEVSRIEKLLPLVDKEELLDKAIAENLDYYVESDMDREEVSRIYKALFYETAALSEDSHAKVYEIRSKDSTQTYRILKSRLENIRNIYKILTGSDLTEESFGKDFLNSLDMNSYDENIRTAIRIYNLKTVYLDQFLFKSFDLALSAPTSTSVTNSSSNQTDNGVESLIVERVSDSPSRYEEWIKTKNNDQQPATSKDVHTTNGVESLIVERVSGSPSRYEEWIKFHKPLTPVEQEQLFNDYQTTPALPFYGSWRGYYTLSDKETNSSSNQDSEVIKTVTNNLGSMTLYDNGTVVLTSDIDSYKTVYKNLSEIFSQRHDIVDIAEHRNALMALRKNGTVIICVYGLKIDQDVISQLYNIESIASSETGFKLKTKDGQDIEVKVPTPPRNIDLAVGRIYSSPARCTEGLVLRKEIKLSNDPLIINLFGVLPFKK